MGEELKKTPVKVTLLKTNWIFRGTKKKEATDFDDLLSIFGQSVNDSIYTTEFVVHLVDEFWSIHQFSIFVTCCIPFLVHFWASVILFSEYFTQEPPETFILKLTITKTLCYVLTMYFQMFEVLQWIELGFTSYWSDLQNWLETSSTIINLVLLINYDFFYGHWFDMNTQQTLAAVAVGLMWFKLFTWMRIYSQTAFFMRLLSETFKDV